MIVGIEAEAVAVDRLVSATLIRECSIDAIGSRFRNVSSNHDEAESHSCEITLLRDEWGFFLVAASHLRAIA